MIKMNEPMSAEQKARDMLERMGVDGAQNFSAGELVELASLIAANDSKLSAITPSVLSALYALGKEDDAPMHIDSESTWRLLEYAAIRAGVVFHPDCEVVALPCDCVEYRPFCTTITVEGLRRALTAYPGGMPVVATWEGTSHGITIEQMSVDNNDGRYLCDCLIIDVDD